MTTAAATKPALAPVPEAHEGDKPKKERKPREHKPKADGFLAEIRASAAKHRASMAKLIETEAELEKKLATVRAQREAAEGPLAEIEAILARVPELPGLDAGPTPAEVNQ